MSLDKPTKPRARPRKPRTRLPGRDPVQVIAVRFPLAYMRIMEAEADRLGVYRGQFLMMLVKRKRGEVMLERGRGALD